MPKGDVTSLLERWSDGDQDALARLMPLVYDELHSLAGAYLHRENPNHTFQTADLVHEAFLRLIDQDRIRWQSRAHFYGIAAQAMRRILVDHARARDAVKRGGRLRKLALDKGLMLRADRAPELIALDDALKSLARLDPPLVKIVELRFFGGLAAHEIARVLGVSTSTVTRGWRTARAWLYQHLAADEARSARSSTA